MVFIVFIYVLNIYFMYLIQIKLGYENLIGGNDIPVKEIDISVYIINVIIFFCLI